MPISPLEHSLNDAEILANYAIHNNIAGMQDAIGGIAEAREQFAAGNLKGDNQRAFYAHYSALAARISPVSVASLKDSLDEYGLEVKDCFFFREETYALPSGDRRTPAKRFCNLRLISPCFYSKLLAYRK
jgi:hypothetical protein